MAFLETLLLLSGVGQDTACPMSGPAAATVVSRANQLRVDGSYAQARSLLEAARLCVVESDPTYPILLNNLAQIYKVTGPKNEVEPLLLAALRAWQGTDRHPNALINLADWCDRQGDSRRAEALLQAALSQYPRMAMAHNNLGSFLHKRRRYDKAEAHYRRALALYQDNGLTGAMQTWGNLGLLLAERKRDGEAIDAFRQMQRFTPLPVEEPAHATCLEVYAILLRRRQDPVAAERVAAAAMRYRVRNAFRHSGL